jgi:hypothetical protein
VEEQGAPIIWLGRFHAVQSPTFFHGHAVGLFAKSPPSQYGETSEGMHGVFTED